MADPEIIVTIGVDIVPASRAEEVETAVMEALAALDPPVGCATMRRVVGEPPAGWEDAHLEQLRAAENAAVDAREERDPAVAQLRDLAEAARAVVEAFGTPGSGHTMRGHVRRLREVLDRALEAPNAGGQVPSEPAVPLRGPADDASGVAPTADSVCTALREFGEALNSQSAPSGAQAGSCDGG